MNRKGKKVWAVILTVISVIMPFFINRIPVIGTMLLPMHFPILICGYLCGWYYGMMAGFAAPLIGGVLFGMPPLMPYGIAMAFEMAVYGMMTGFLYRRLPKKTPYIYVSLLGAIAVGRIVWVFASLPLYGIVGYTCTARTMLQEAVIDPVLGTILQIVMIPVMVMALKRMGVLEEQVKEQETEETIELLHCAGMDREKR